MGGEHAQTLKMHGKFLLLAEIRGSAWNAFLFSARQSPPIAVYATLAWSANTGRLNQARLGLFPCECWSACEETFLCCLRPTETGYRTRDFTWSLHKTWCTVTTCLKCIVSTFLSQCWGAFGTFPPLNKGLRHSRRENRCKPQILLTHTTDVQGIYGCI